MSVEETVWPEIEEAQRLLKSVEDAILVVDDAAWIRSVLIKVLKIEIAYGIRLREMWREILALRGAAE